MELMALKVKLEFLKFFAELLLLLDHVAII